MTIIFFAISHRFLPSMPVAKISGCNIKGNIAASGERIYRLPRDMSYNAAVVSVSKGERWFCSEIEASAAGWRHSYR